MVKAVRRIKVEEVDSDVSALFAHYLAICNEAIAKNKEKFPYKEVLSVSETLMRNHAIDLAVYDDKPKGVFSLQLGEGKLTCTQSPPEDPKKAWRVNLSYLENVVQNPEKYIAHPEKLDLDWLKSRVGL